MLHNVSCSTRPVARRVIGALLCASLIAPAVLALPTSPVQAQTLNVYPLPSGLPSGDASSQWSVTVNGQSSGVYQFSGLSYTTFSTDAAVSVNATFSGSVSSVVIRPKSYGIAPTVNGRTVSFTLSPNQKVSVEVNGGGWGNTLFVFADPLEVNPPGPNTPGVAYFGPGYYNIGQDWCFPNNTTTLYVAGGAYLAGTIYCNGKSNLTIKGRGVLSGEGVPLDSHNSNYGSWLLDNSGGNIVDGVTFVNSQQYGPGGVSSSIDDIKVINPGGAGSNRTGIFFGGNGTTIQNSFVWAGDDALDIEGSTNETIQNIVVATSGGDAIQLNWNGSPSNDTINNIDIIHYTGGNYVGYQGAIGSIDSCTANPVHDIMVENVRLEGPLSDTHLFALHTGKSNFCSYTGPLAPIYNVTFKNISAEQNGTWNNGSILAGNDSGSAVHDICFQNLTIGGTLVTAANASSYFTLGANAHHIAFPGTGACPSSGSTTINDTDSGIVYSGACGGSGSWASGSNRNLGDYNNDEHYAAANGDSFSYSFSGTGISWIGEKNNEGGTDEVYVDNVDKGSVSTYNVSRLAQQTLYSIASLPAGSHTLRVVKTGGSFIEVDALTIQGAGSPTGGAEVNDTDGGIAYNGSCGNSWASGSNRNLGDYNNDEHYAAANGDSFSYSFSGTGISWIGEKNNEGGTDEVYVDNVDKGSVSTYNVSRLAQQTLYSIASLPAGSHTLRVVKTGGSFIEVDAIAMSQ